MSIPFVSVIIPVFNDPERLTRCLSALEAQNYPQDRFEVIVVDNGSEEGLRPLVTPSARVKATSESRPGSYAARNRGLSVAKGEVIAFTDADCIPAPDWLERGVAALRGVPNCGLVGGHIELFARDPEHPTIVELYDQLTAFRQEEYVEVAQFGATANVFTYRKVIEHVGAFDDAVKSCGDLEWGQRVFDHGYRVVYANDVRVAHPASPSLAEICRRATRIIGGMHDLDRRKRCRYIGLGRGFLLDSLPPLRLSLRAWRDSGRTALTRKVQVILLVCFMQYARVWEKVRLSLGGKSKR
jgi:glycosyltransferase involved in cell wall biosynthesis